MIFAQTWGVFMSRSWKCRLIAVIAMVLSIQLILPLIRGVKADIIGWEAPELVSDIAATYPSIVADAHGNLHAFWSIGSDVTDTTPISEYPIYYSRRDQDGWSSPVDILIGRQPEAIVDDDGYLHLFWVGSDAVWHSWNALEDAQSVQKWQTGSLLAYLGPQSSAWFPFSVEEDATGVFHFVFNSRDAQGLWSLSYMQSFDQGMTWSEPVGIIQMPSDQACVLPRLVLDDAGGLHVTWTQEHLPDGWPPTGVYYAHSYDQGATWSAPAQLGGSLQGWSNIVTVGDSVVHVVWNGSAEGQGRYHRWSSDGGLTWTSAQMIIDQGGLTQGWPSMAVDSNDVVHWVDFGHTGDSVTGWETIVYSYWDQGYWSPPEFISPNTESGGYTAQPKLTVSQGNLLHLVWVNISRSGLINTPGVWYATKNTGSPSVAPQPTPTPLQNLDEDLPTTTRPIVVEPTEFRLEDLATPVVELGNPLGAVLLGGASALGLFVIVALLRRGVKR